MNKVPLQTATIAAKWSSFTLSLYSTRTSRKEGAYDIERHGISSPRDLAVSCEKEKEQEQKQNVYFTSDCRHSQDDPREGILVIP